MAKEQTASKMLFLIDYEFVGESIDGLTVIEDLEIARQSVLVSSHFDNPEIMRRVATLGCRVLRKSLVPYIPLRVEPHPVVSAGNDGLTK